MIRTKAFDAELFDALFHQFSLFLRIQNAAAGNFAQVGDLNIFCYGFLQQQTFGFTVLGDETDTVCDSLSRFFNGNFLAFDVDITAIYRQIAEDSLHDLGTAGTHQTCNTQNFAGFYGEVHVVEFLAAGKTFYADHFVADFNITMWVTFTDLTTDHHLNNVIHCDVFDVFCTYV